MNDSYRLGDQKLSIPEELYIDPDALIVELNNFSGPFDLLLYLIKKNNIDLLNIPVAVVCDQYLQFIRQMSSKNYELVAEYLSMAAILIELKARQIAIEQQPKTDDDDDPGEDLRKIIIAHEEVEQMTRLLTSRDMLHVNFFETQINHKITVKPPQLNLKLTQLQSCMHKLMHRYTQIQKLSIATEQLSTEEAIKLINQKLHKFNKIELTTLLISNSKQMLVTSFIIILEMLKSQKISISKQENKIFLGIKHATTT